MTTPGDDIDSRLKTLLSGLDTSSNFDLCVLARLREESVAIAAQRRRQALELEARRYRVEKKRIGWRAWLQRTATLDNIGVALLATFGAHALWLRTAHPIADFMRQYTFEILTSFGILLTVSPLIMLLIERMPRRSRFT